MAKSGQVQLNSGSPGDSDLADSVVFTESTPTSIGGIVADLLDKSVDALKLLVDTLGRIVFAYPSATDVSVAVAGANLKLIGTITRDDATRKSSPVTMAAGDDISANLGATALAAALNDMFGASKPSKNIASLVNAVEDAYAGLQQSEKDDLPALAVVVDQTGDGSVKVYVATTINGTDTLVPTANIKQVPAATGGTTTPLPFE